jgi:hypothetical protein
MVLGESEKCIERRSTEFSGPKKCVERLSRDFSGLKKCVERLSTTFFGAKKCIDLEARASTASGYKGDRPLQPTARKGRLGMREQAEVLPSGGALFRQDPIDPAQLMNLADGCVAAPRPNLL